MKALRSVAKIAGINPKELTVREYIRLPDTSTAKHNSGRAVGASLVWVRTQPSAQLSAGPPNEEGKQKKEISFPTDIAI